MILRGAGRMSVENENKLHSKRFMCSALQYILREIW